MVLIQLRVHRIDFTLSEGVIQSIVDGRRSHPETRCGGTIDLHLLGCGTQLLVCDHICQLWQLFQLCNELLCHRVQLCLVGIFQRVLVLRSAHHVIDGQILDWLHVELDAGYFLQLRREAVDDLRCRELALFQRLEVDLNPTAVERRICSVGPDER